jgi:hypothetical protein
MVEDNGMSVCEELKEQRCIIEGQQVEIRRLQHQTEMQRRHISYVEAELAAIKGTLQRVTSIRPRTQRSPNHGFGNGNGNGRHTALQLSNDDTIGSADVT